MKKLVLLTSLVLISLLGSSQSILKGVASNIYDGDTFTLLQEDGTKTKIRIVGIDAPEAKQDYGITSRDFARSLLDGRQLTVYLEPGETYSRSLGVVITADGLHFNYEMVAKGYAWWYADYSTDKYLKVAQERAKKKKLGLWSTSSPQAPWEWRRENK